MNAPRRILLLTILAVAAFGVACDDDDDAEPTATATETATETPTPTPTATATATATPDDGDRSTGNAELDALLAAIESADAAALRELIEFQTLACTTAAGPGGPPKCREGEADGTDIVVFESVACEAQWDRDDTVDAFLESAAGITPMRYAGFTPPGGYLLAGEGVVLLLEGPDPRVEQDGFNRGMAVRAVEGRIVAMWLACGAGDGADTMLPAGGADFLLEPTT